MDSKYERMDFTFSSGTRFLARLAKDVLAEARRRPQTASDRKRRRRRERTSRERLTLIRNGRVRIGFQRGMAAGTKPSLISAGRRRRGRTGAPHGRTQAFSAIADTRANF